MNRDLIVFGEDWKRHSSSTQHIIRNLPGDRRILWVNSIGMRRPRFSIRDARRLAGKLLSIARGKLLTGGGLESPTDRISVISPFVIPWPGSKTAAVLNRLFLARQLRRKMRSEGIRQPILWTSLPTAVIALGTLCETKIVYYCGDDFGTLAGVDHGPVMAYERQLVERADLIIVPSTVLAERFPKAKTLYVAQGVDLSVFQAPAARADDLPVGRPIAGFVGMMADWVDVVMLRQTALEMPDWWFVFVGGIETDVSPLEGIENVQFLGKRPYEVLGSYVQHWNVSLMPFTDSPVIRASNPLKLREYLAAGTPVATTDFPALEPYRNLLSVVPRGGRLSEAIRKANLDTGRNALRKESVAEATWEQRAKQVADALEQLG